MRDEERFFPASVRRNKDGRPQLYAAGLGTRGRRGGWIVRGRPRGEKVRSWPRWSEESRPRGGDCTRPAAARQGRPAAEESCRPHRGDGCGGVRTARSGGDCTWLAAVEQRMPAAGGILAEIETVLGAFCEPRHVGWAAAGGWSGDATAALVRCGRPSLPSRQSWRLSSALICQPRRVAGEDGGDGRGREKVCGRPQWSESGRPGGFANRRPRQDKDGRPPGGSWRRSHATGRGVRAAASKLDRWIGRQIDVADLGERGRHLAGRQPSASGPTWTAAFTPGPTQRAAFPAAFPAASLPGPLGFEETPAASLPGPDADGRLHAGPDAAAASTPAPTRTAPQHRA